MMKSLMVRKSLSPAKKNNKGFTLIELIIVIAIIAVLAAVIAPQYIKYVEKSKESSDCNSAASIEQAVNVLVADGKMKDGGYVTWTCTNASGAIAVTSAGTGGTATDTDLTDVLGSTVKTQSAKANTAAHLYFVVKGTNVIVSATKTDGTEPYSYLTQWKS